MTDSAAADPMGEDPAMVGFALLMAGVESAVAAAADEIAALSEVVRQGAMGVTTTPPPALPTGSVRPPAPAALPPSEQARDRAMPEVALPTAGPRPTAALVAPAASPVNAGRGTVLPVTTRPSGQAAPAVEPVQALAPAVVRQQDLREPSPVAPAAHSLSTAIPLPAAAAIPMREAAATMIAPSAPSRFAGDLPVAAPAPIRSRSALEASSVRVAPVAPPAVSAPVAPSSVPERSVAPVTRGETPSPSPSGSGGPTQGDVYLDGVRVGRWMSDTLARAAGGPSRGSTGFDPRMGPRWPGALQGR